MERKVLIAHPWVGRGGSEAAAAWAVQALQEDYDVSFVTSSPLDWDDINAVYGCAVDPAKLRYIRSPKAPTVNSAHKLVQMQRKVVEKYCRKIAGEFDLCISSYNPIYFGRPGIQLIGDFSFSEEMRKRLYIHGESRFCHRETILRKMYLKMSDLAGPPAPPIDERGDLVLANSKWSAEQLQTFFSIENADVIYPPVILPTAPPGATRDPYGFVCLGRIVPEKELERIVSILDRVRQQGFPVTLHLIGDMDDSAYSRSISRLVEPLGDWIVKEGYLTLDKKQKVLSEQTYAIHACRIEAFGIAVAEMASMGCVPFVPATGGAGEIVPDPELQFESDDEAVEKIVRFLKSPEKAEAVQGNLPAAMSRFGPTVFMNELREHVGRFTMRSEQGNKKHGVSRKDFASSR